MIPVNVLNFHVLLGRCASRISINCVMPIDLKIKIIKLGRLFFVQNPWTWNGKDMSVFDNEDNQTIRTLGWTMVGFVGLTVFLIVLATSMVD